MGLGVPRWWFTAPIPLFCAAIALRAGRRRLASLARTRSGAEPGGRARPMIGTLLFVVFVGLMLAGVPIAVALGIGGIAAIAAANADAPWWGLFAAPQNMHASIAKYPLLALPMFVLVGSIFDRSGVARRMVTFAEACVGRAPAPCRWSRSWSRWCSAASPARGRRMPAAVGGVMIAAMAKAGYRPRSRPAWSAPPRRPTS
jgi:TRAP-type mannitol/chloroaromatic compound transport system permease large subunit